MKRLFSPVRLIALIETSRPSDRWLLRILLALCVVTLAWFLLALNNTASVDDVRSGGSISEGILGTPRFVNPVLALTRADQDVTEIVYSGLLRQAADGTLEPDLAAGWTVSADGTVYTVALRDNITFHDEVPVTATDVVYTIELIQNDDLKSPLRSNYSGVTAVALDDRTIEFTLSEPYTPFLHNLTVGILPAHIWRSIPIEQVPFSSYNTTPIGSGPYQIVDTTFSKNGTVEHYELDRFTAHTPVGLLEDITLTFYTEQEQLQEALTDGDIDGTAYLDAVTVASWQDQDTVEVLETPLTRTFGLFFNQNRSEILRDAAVREALDLALDRSVLVTNGLSGAGIPTASIVMGAVPTLESGDVHGAADESPLTIAALVLEEAGWTKNSESGIWELVDGTDRTPLSVTIRTANAPLFQATLASITDQWEAFGVQVVTEQFEQTDLLQSVIRERDFTVLLFGIDPGTSGDLFAFLHSSQQNDPGLNIAQYANLTVDDALETLRTSQDSDARQAARATIDTIVTEERPALFLFRPTVQYVNQSGATPVLPAQLDRPADRFRTITSWYANARQVWPFFTEDNEEVTDFNTEN